MRVDGGGGAADRRHPRVGGGERGLSRARLLTAATGRGRIVGPAVARREVHRDALDRGELEQVLVLGDRRRRLVARGRVQRTAPRVGDDVGAVMRDQIGEGGQEIGVLAGVRAVVDDLGAGSHGVHSLDVQRLLGAPPRGPAALVHVVPAGRRDDLRVLPRGEGRKLVVRRPRVGVGQHRARSVSIDDGDGRLAAGVADGAVSAPQLRSRVPADGVRLMHTGEGRIGRVGVLPVVVRAGGRDQRPRRRAGSAPPQPQVLRSSRRRDVLCVLRQRSVRQTGDGGHRRSE